MGIQIRHISKTTVQNLLDIFFDFIKGGKLVFELLASLDKTQRTITLYGVLLVSEPFAPIWMSPSVSPLNGVLLVLEPWNFI